MIDKVNDDDRQKRNQDSLVAAASGKEKPVKVTPARRKQQNGDGDPATRNVAPGPVKPGPTKPGAKPQPKSNGGGRGRGGKRTEGGDSGSESDTPTWTGVPRKPASEYAGTAVKDIPSDKKCCLQYCWVRKDGVSLCWNFNKGVQCTLGKHVAPNEIPEEMRKTNLYAKLLAERGKPNCPKNGPKPPAAPEKA